MKASKQGVLGIALARLVVHFLPAAVLGQAGEPNTPQPAVRTGCYVFLTEQSTIVQTGGFAGVHGTYALEGRFCLILDPDAKAAQFERIEAGAVEAEEPAQTLDPNETFNLTDLTGTIIDETTVEFKGQAADGSDVSLTLIFDEDAVYLTGQTTPPPNSADFFLFSIDAVATRKYAGGAGDPDAPHQIATAADIDLDPNLPGGRIFDRALIAPHHGDMEWSLLAPEFQGTAFSGILEGNGCIVANLTVDGGTGAYLALFGSVSGSAAIRGVALEHAVVTGREYVAGLVGYNEGTVSDCQVTCCLQGEGFAPWRFGGLAAFNAGYIDNCRVTGAIWGLDSSGYFAGLIGWNEGTITDSRASVDITGGAGCWEVGGLVGDNRGPVTNCHATGNVTGGDRCKFLGGLVGMNYYTTLTNCSAGGHVSAGVRSDRVAGLVGGCRRGVLSAEG